MYEMNFKSYMITFTKDSRRLSNFNDVRSKLNSLELFEAANAIDHYDILELMDKKFGFHAKKYLDEWKWLPGKLGCNLSWLLLFKKIQLNYSFNPEFPKWFLIMEDDTELLEENIEDKISSIIKEAEELDSYFIKFLLGSGKEKLKNGIVEFSADIQFSERYHIKDNFYKLIPSWGNWAQIFHMEAIEAILSVVPWDDHLDLLLMDSPVFEKLNGVAYKQDFFTYSGATRLEEADKNFGSLIYKNSTTGKVDWRKLTRL
tara:strand:+ start:10754 stop:11530 length:777 start_codon:yes stop_codon:yes gene_type:complete